MQEVFETFYTADWNNAEAARNARRKAIGEIPVAVTIVSGVVKHPVYGLGYELFYRLPGEHRTSDVRSLPGATENQSSPRLVRSQERF